MTGYGDKMDRVRGIAGNSRGYTITELIVVTVIFLTVMMITSSAFKTIAHSTARESKAAETQISGIIGLDILRADLEQAGFGLPWSFQNTPVGYQEAYDATYNDAPSTPRGIVSGFNKTLFGSYTGSKYICIKSTVIANNETAKKWTSVTFKNTSTIRRPWGESQRDFSADEKVIVLRNKPTGDPLNPVTRQLLVDRNTGAFFTTFSQYSTLTQSHGDNENFQIYGIAPASYNGSLRMPFNRADYYVGLPATAGDLPASCAPNTGILYKATINHGNGYRSPAPLLDCVADLQIVYGLDTGGSGNINDYATLAPDTALWQRAQIKEIRVYVLAQEGNRDVVFNYPSPSVDVGETLNGVFTGRRFDLASVIGADYKYYRWKVYTIVVRPKNLIQ